MPVKHSLLVEFESRQAAPALRGNDAETKLK